MIQKKCMGSRNPFLFFAGSLDVKLSQWWPWASFHTISVSSSVVSLARCYSLSLSFVFWVSSLCCFYRLPNNMSSSDVLSGTSCTSASDVVNKLTSISAADVQNSFCFNNFLFYIPKTVPMYWSSLLIYTIRGKHDSSSNVTDLV